MDPCYYSRQSHSCCFRIQYHLDHNCLRSRDYPDGNTGLSFRNKNSWGRSRGQGFRSSYCPCSIGRSRRPCCHKVEAEAEVEAVAEVEVEDPARRRLGRNRRDSIQGPAW